MTIQELQQQLYRAIAAGDQVTVTATALELAVRAQVAEQLLEQAEEQAAARRAKQAERVRRHRAEHAKRDVQGTEDTDVTLQNVTTRYVTDGDVTGPSLPPCPPSLPPAPSLSPPYNPPSHPKNAAPISAPSPAEPSLFGETAPADHDSSQSNRRLNDVAAAAPELEPPETPKRSRGPSKHWLLPVARAWETKMGAGTFPWAKAGHALKPLERAGVAPDAIAANLARYLEKTDPRYTNLARFAETFAAWDDPGPLVDANGVLTPRGMAALRGAA